MESQIGELSEEHQKYNRNTHTHTHTHTHAHTHLKHAYTHKAKRFRVVEAVKKVYMSYKYV